MRTLIIAVALLSTFSPVRADTYGQLRIFADCVGRLSAVMEHQWMFDGPASEQTQKHRAAVLDLLDAVMVADDAVRVMQWRLTAKHAQAQLLTRAAFNRDQSDAAWAMTQARRFERSCTGLLLS